MTESTQTKFSVGDTIVSDEKRSILFRRDCVVAYADDRLFALVTEGLPEVFFFDFDDAKMFNVATPGIGDLTDAQSGLLRATLNSWEYMGVLSKFPDLVKSELNNASIDTKDTDSVAIMATVPKKLAFFWRQQHAALALARVALPQVPQDVEQLMATWGMLSALKIGASVHGPDILRRMFGQRSE